MTEPAAYSGQHSTAPGQSQALVTAIARDGLTSASPSPKPTPHPFGRERGAQRQDAIVWCSTCRRNHPRVRCMDWGEELPPHFLARYCERRKSLHRRNGWLE
jgi:hypothetical protein